MIDKRTIITNAAINAAAKDNTRMVGGARAESLRYASGATTPLDRQREQMANILSRAKNKKKKDGMR